MIVEVYNLFYQRNHMNILIFIPIFVILLILLSIWFFVFSAVFNHIFFSFSIKQLVFWSLIINAIYLLLFITTMTLGNSILGEIHTILNYYLWILLYAMLISLVYWMIFIVFRIFHFDFHLSNHWVGYGLILVIVMITWFAIYNYHKWIQVKNFVIESSKVTKPYKFVQIGDIQFGSSSKHHLEDTINLALEQKPDFIVFVWDLVDTNNYSVEDFQIFSKLSVPMYFVSGNHEYIHKYDKLRNILEQYPQIIILDEDKVKYDEIDIIGLDYNNLESLENIEVNQNSYSVFLYHVPKNIELGVKKWFDLMLYGHTHGGQLFPLNFITESIYPHSKDFHKVENTDVYTTLGAWLRGPRMRLGSENELVVFELKP